MKLSIFRFKRVLLMILFLVLSSSFAYSYINIDLDVPSYFSKDEVIYFNFTITSNESQDIIYTPYIYCEHSGIIRTPSFAYCHVDSLHSCKGTYSYGTADSVNGVSKCIASISIISPVSKNISKSFIAEGRKVVPFDVYISKSSNCDYKETTVSRSTPFYICIGSENRTLPEKIRESINIQLIYPSSKNISITDLSKPLSFSNKGEYRIVAVFKGTSKYKPFTSYFSFYVVSNSLKLTHKMFSEITPENKTDILENNFNSFNKENKSMKTSFSEVIKRFFFNYWMVVLIVLFIIFYIVYIRNIRKK